METASLMDLAPILGIVLGSMMTFTVAIMRFHHVDNSKLRDMIERSSQENRELIEQSQRETRELIEKVHVELSGGLSDVRRDLGDVRRDLGEVKERLARVEGYLGRWPEPPPLDGAAA